VAISYGERKNKSFNLADILITKLNFPLEQQTLKLFFFPIDMYRKNGNR